MVVRVYEWGTNKFFEKRLVAVLRDVTEIKDDNTGKRKKLSFEKPVLCCCCIRRMLWIWMKSFLHTMMFVLTLAM